MRIFILFCLQIGVGFVEVGCAPAASPGGSGGSGGSGGAGSSSGGLGNSETGVGTGGMPTGTGGPPTSTGVGSSTGVGTSGTGKETGGSTGCSFSCDPSDTDGLPSEDCDVVGQDCPAGQKCVAWAKGGGGSWNATKCVVVTGDQEPGEPCTAQGSGASGEDDCVKGAMCWNVDEGLMGVCVANCSGSKEMPLCPDGVLCSSAADGVVWLCLPDCNPLVQDCPGDDLCVPNGNFVCLPDASGKQGQVNDGCAWPNECDKGLACIEAVAASSACDPAAFGCCQPFCEFPGGGCPNLDQACVQWYDPMDVSPDSPKLKYGVCKVPE